MKEREGGQEKYVSSNTGNRKGAGGVGGSSLPNPRVLGRVELKTIRPGITVGTVLLREECQIIDIYEELNMVCRARDRLVPRRWWRRPRKPQKVIGEVFDDSIYELIGDLFDAIDRYIAKVGGELSNMSKVEVLEKVLARGQAEAPRNVTHDTRG